jgi:murein DD-endopeptidase MepM/ murein hydrolase activator NlpD
MAAIEAFKNTVSGVRYWEAVPFQRPVSQCMNSPFGVKRFYNGVFSGNYHKGIDQKSPAGTPIKPIASGVVKIARPYQLHGGTVAVDHGQGVGSIYIHMSKILVKPNQVVTPSDTLGLVGSTGFAMGPHLHWGLYVFGIPVNPLAGFVSTTACG